MKTAQRISQRSTLPLLITAFILLLVGIAAGGSLALGSQTVDQSPDFGDVNDPLNGDYQLFTVDDLLIARTKGQNNNTTSEINNYILETENETISSQAKQTLVSPPCYLSSGRQPQQVRIGRFYNLPYDVIVTLTPTLNASGSDCSGANNMSLHIEDRVTSDQGYLWFTTSAKQTAVAMDDFNLDGFEDLFIMNDTELFAAAAVDVDDKSAGMKIGPATALASTPHTSHDPVTGDFNNDGLRDVAWIGGGSVYFATICPGSVPGTICDGKQALEVLLNPQESRTVPLPGSVALAAGTFGSFEGTGLLLTNSDNLFPATTFAHWYQFDSSWNVIGGAEISSVVVSANSFDVLESSFAVAERLDWFGSTDQVVIAYHGQQFGAGGGNAIAWLNVNVVTFNSAQNTMSAYSTGGIDPHNTGYIAPPNPPWLNGLAVGRFASIGDDAGDAEFNPQIVILRNDGVLKFFSVDPSAEDYTPKLLSQEAVDPSLGLNLLPTAGFGQPQEDFGLNWLTTGDLQGRSARLGPPSVIRVASHSQPSVILGAPPMHVDYILPDSSTGQDWEIVNFSAVPDTFNSNYTMSQSTTSQSSDTNRTSYTYATTQISGPEFSYKPPYIPKISGSIKKTSKDKSEDVSETYAFTQNEFKYDASTTTGFSDEIWYDESSFNVYLYPVLGETICPADNGDCAPSEEQPLYVTFSGPNSGGTGPGPGANTEWYQPVHEPGNIFSYPWNEAQLAKQIPQGIDILTGPQHFFTDSSSQAQRLTWSQGAGKDQTTGTTNDHSYEKSYSLTGGKIIGKIVDKDIKGNFSYSDSSSISTLNKSSSSVGASQGVTISKPGTFLDFGLYQYRVEPYIFGRIPSPGKVDDVALPQDIQTTGPLQTAFAVNPLDLGAGSWWGSDNSPYTQDIDVALNHPLRWKISNPTGTQEALNCLNSAGTRNNCVSFNDPDPNNLWNSEFYWMRGLFPTVGGVNGPQRSQAAEGDDVVLQARVYNYSFKDMPSGSSIKVRFYRQEIKGTTPVGDSVLIGEETAGSLPGFNSDSSPDTANWTTVTTTLDTTGLGDTYNIFWVLVWVEDGSGSMVAEIDGHGLSAKPGNLATIGDVPLEEVMLDGQSKTFSNNVGYLHSKFYIAQESPQPLPPPGEPVLEILNAQVTPAESAPGGRVIVSADILSESAPAEAVHVRLYPDAAAWQAYQNDASLPHPQPFDVEMLPFIDINETDRIEVPYSASSCGTQEILIVARAGIQTEAVTATATYSNGPCLVYNPVVPIGVSN